MKGSCKNCSRTLHGELPKEIGKSGFGVRTQAMVGLLSSKYRLSKRQIKDWFKDVYSLPMSLGSVSNIEHTVSQSLEEIHSSIRAKIKEEPIIHLDETGFRQSNANGWAWIMSTPQHTCFTLAASRGRKVAKELVGNHHGHVYVTDRYAAYNWLPDQNRQVTWSNRSTHPVKR